MRDETLPPPLARDRAHQPMESIPVTMPSVTVNATDVSGAETAANPIVFTLTRSGSTASALAVNVAWSGGALCRPWTAAVYAVC